MTLKWFVQFALKCWMKSHDAVYYRDGKFWKRDYWGRGRQIEHSRQQEEKLGNKPGFRLVSSGSWSSIRSAPTWAVKAAEWTGAPQSDVEWDNEPVRAS